MRGAPWPVRIMVIGDSYSTNPGQVDWQEKAALVYANTQVIFEDFASSGKALWDNTGVLGADTIEASIDADLAASPNSDIVIWVSSAINDILRRRQGLNAATGVILSGASAGVLSKIRTAKKGCIVMGVPFVQALISNPQPTNDADAQAAYTARLEFNTALQSQCATAGFTYYLPRWMYNDFGPITLTGQNGLKPEYASDASHAYDGLHPNNDAFQRILEDLMACVGNINRRIKAA
jgi:lysophospholipase L1-like esterase